MKIELASSSPWLSGEVLERLESTELESMELESTELESMEPGSTKPELTKVFNVKRLLRD